VYIQERQLNCCTSATDNIDHNPPFTSTTSSSLWNIRLHFLTSINKEPWGWDTQCMKPIILKQRCPNFLILTCVHWTKVLSVHLDNSNDLETERLNDTNFEQFCNWCVSWTLTLKKKNIMDKNQWPVTKAQNKKWNPCSKCFVPSATFKINYNL
jgi:hypothetical protein